jgi:ATP-dependent RNA helicase DDX55/SPB4
MWEELKEKLNISPEIINILTNIYKFDKITKVQYIVINEFLKNQDVIVKSITGSGKTLSYIIPLFQRLIKYSSETENYKNKILCLILLPSRELSEQVFNDINIFINNILEKFTCQLLIGGKKIENDLEKLSNEIPNIIVATPGRLIDIDDKMKLQFNELQLLIIDEADKMLDMGFEMAVSSIISKLPKQRRTGLFSATVTSNVENIIKAGMRNPIFIDIFINGKNNNNIFIENSDLKIKNLGNYGNYYKIIPFSQDNYQINNIKNEVPKGLNQYYRLIKNIKYKIPHLIQILNSLYNTEKNKKIMLFLST